MPRIDEQAVKNAFAECACMSPDCCDLYFTGWENAIVTGHTANA